jgi:hypothetical protein
LGVLRQGPASKARASTAAPRDAGDQGRQGARTPVTDPNNGCQRARHRRQAPDSLIGFGRAAAGSGWERVSADRGAVPMGIGNAAPLRLAAAPLISISARSNSTVRANSGRGSCSILVKKSARVCSSERRPFNILSINPTVTTKTATPGREDGRAGGGWPGRHSGRVNGLCTLGGNGQPGMKCERNRLPNRYGLRARRKR